MKQLIRIGIIILFVLSNPGLTLSAAAPPPAERPDLAQVEAAFRQAIDLESRSLDSFWLYDTQLEGVRLSIDGNWAYSELIPLDPQTGWPIAVEPGISLAQWNGTTWDVFLPTNPKWRQAVKSHPGFATRGCQDFLAGNPIACD